MSKTLKKLDVPKQIGLFEKIQKMSESKEPKKGTLNISVEFKILCSKCVKNSKYSVNQIAYRMTEYMDNGDEDSPAISHHQVYAWCSVSKKDYRLPAEYVPAFCYGTGFFEPVEFLGQHSNRYIMPGREALRSVIQKREEEIKALEIEREKMLLFLEMSDKK